MSGVEITGYLIGSYVPLTAIVAGASIKDGPLGVGAILPALAVEHVSGTHQQLLDQSIPTFIVDRVQVTIFARNTRERRVLTRLVLEACAGRRGDMLGLTGVDVQSAGQGPDFYDERASIFMRTQDFRVAFNTA